MTHKRFHRSGFTIVELLVVITIIGILLTLSFFGYGAYRQNAKNAQTATSVDAYQNAFTSMTHERNLFENKTASFYACLSTTNDANPCCYTNHASGGLVYYACTNNTTIGDFSSIDVGLSFTASQVSAWTKKYLPSSLPPKLPVSSGAAACTASSAV